MPGTECWGEIRDHFQTSLQLCRLPVRSPGAEGQTHARVMADPQCKNIETTLPTDLSGLTADVPDKVTNITEKQLHLGRLHKRPIQWHLQSNWRVPESLEKVIPIPKSLHPHLKWWLQEENILQGQPLHPLKHAMQIFTDISKEGWGAHLGEHIAR